MVRCPECGRKFYETVNGNGFSFLRQAGKIIQNTETGARYCFDCGKPKMDEAKHQNPYLYVFSSDDLFGKWR